MRMKKTLVLSLPGHYSARLKGIREKFMAVIMIFFFLQNTNQDEFHEARGKAEQIFQNKDSITKEGLRFVGFGGVRGKVLQKGCWHFGQS